MMERPKKCCSVGTYGCTVPMPIRGRVRGIDFCIADIVAALNAANIVTVCSCCGHDDTVPSEIHLEDGRKLIVVNAKKASSDEPLETARSDEEIC